MPRRYYKSRKGKHLKPQNALNYSNYYVADRYNQSLYYLDIGMWWALLLDKYVLKDPKELPTFILEECYNLSAANADYYFIVNFVYNRLSPDLIKFCKDTEINDIFIFNNKNKELDICKSLKYKFTGHRLYEIDSEQYNQLLNNLNSHLKSKNPQFNPSLYKDNPYFDTFVSDKMRAFL